MSNYLFAYHGKASGDVMAKWGGFFQGLGDAVVNPGNPVKTSSTVSANGVTEGAGHRAQAGFSIVKADSMEAAVKLTKGCPALENDGNVVVSELIEM